MRAKKPLTPDAARIRAEELCARADYSAGEIRERLIRWGIFPSDADRIVDALIDTRFIDDERFARAFVRDKIEFARWGKRKIALALYHKRVARDIINETLDDYDEASYLAALDAVLASKRRTIAEPDTYEGRTKLFRHAASRGFEPDLIAAALRR